MSTPAFELVVTIGEREIARHALGPGEYFAGSAEGCDIAIPGGVSGRKYAKISIGQNGRVIVEDLESENGTLLDDLPIVVAGWTPGHLLRFGQVRVELWPVANEFLAAPAKPAVAASAPPQPAPLLDDDPGLVRPVATPAAVPRKPGREEDAIVLPKSARQRRMAWWTVGVLGAVVLGLVAQHLLFSRGGSAPGFSAAAKAQSSYLRAVEEIERSAFSEALDEIEAAIAGQPGVANYYFVKGNILQSLGRLTEARAAYDLALQRDTGHRQASEARAVSDQILQTDGATLTPAGREKLAALMHSQRRESEAAAMEAR